MSYRPVKSPYYGRHIDQRTESRPASSADLELISRAIEDLGTCWLEVVLVPAPDPHFIGHRVRAVCSENPRWYQKLSALHTWQLKRGRVMRSLLETVRRGVIRGNGYVREVLAMLRREEEREARMSPGPGEANDPWEANDACCLKS